MSEGAFTKPIPLGPTDIRISPMGLGAWSWGARFMWGYGREYGEPEIRQAFDASLAGGITFFDTADSYGGGLSERLLGRFAAAHRSQAVIASKCFPYPWRLNGAALVQALKRSLARLGVDAVDLYQMHWPTPLVSIEEWMRGMAEAHDQGLTRAVGVSNYSIRQMERAHAALARRSIPLASNQVSYSLLNRSPERTGLLDRCREMKVTVIAYSPLAQGWLTGKFTPDRLPRGVRAFRYPRGLPQEIGPLLALMREIGQNHGGKTPSQVALNWVMCKGAVPIPGAKNARQAQENLGAIGWRMTEAEVARLDDASQRLAR